jgi:uncharacterized protein (DUF885 family)
MPKVAALVVLALMAAGCGGRNSVENLSGLSDEFVFTTLSFSPSVATGVGLHQYRNRKLDDLLDDMSPRALDEQRRFYEGFAARLGKLDAGRMSAEDRADLGVIRDQIALSLLDLNTIHSYQHNPTVYVEALGNALFSPYVLEYADKAARMRSVVARLEKVPLYLEQAAGNLTSAPGIWTNVAMEENQGNLDLVDKTIRAAVPDDLREAYGRAAEPAMAAMRKFQDFLKTSLAKRDQADWRLGRDLYTRKFHYVLESGVEADSMLETATADLSRVRARMLELALPLHSRMFAAHGDHSGLAGDERINRVVGEVLARIADRHSTPDSYMADARQDLAEARAFVERKHLLTLPPRSNLQVIPTPDFMRGIYSVGGFDPAPALEPQLGAFYWVTPVPANWPRERAESKLREYNFYKLKLLTIHEAMPGHYVQMEVANDVQPKSRRVLRSVFGNNPYIEGWAEFATQTMLDEGFLDHSPEMALTFAKEELRVIANAILDVRLHMLHMTDQEALDLMRNQTFQEKEEAVEKLQRAKLSSCQLPTYFVGWRGWRRVREEYRKAAGASYSPAGFNDRALREGAVPLPGLGELMK